MKELQYLQSMWKPKIRRDTEQLVVPKVSYHDKVGSLHNEHWAYQVTYAAREALDLSFDERVKDKKPYYIWTQGPILSFKEGDSFTAKDGKTAVQVRHAQRMGWDKSKAEMHQGNVTFESFSIKRGQYEKLGTTTCSQMEFLELLIYGSEPQQISLPV